MKMSSGKLIVGDAVVNLVFGIFLLAFPKQLVSLMALPHPLSAFYPSVLGAILIGIGFALLLHRFRPSLGGLGIGGAIAINLCGGIVLATWLLAGALDIATRGYVILWAIVLILIVLSLLEAVTGLRKT